MKRLLLVLSVVCALCFTVAACDNGGSNSADSQSSVRQDSVEDSVQTGTQSEQLPSGAETSEEGQPSGGETSSGEQSSEPENSSADPSSDEGTKLPGGLVDMGNFESKQ